MRIQQEIENQLKNIKEVDDRMSILFERDQMDEWSELCEVKHKLYKELGLNTYITWKHNL